MIIEPKLVLSCPTLELLLEPSVHDVEKERPSQRLRVSIREAQEN
jgi:hypothetical protein